MINHYCTSTYMSLLARPQFKILRTVRVVVAPSFLNNFGFCFSQVILSMSFTSLQWSVLLDQIVQVTVLFGNDLGCYNSSIFPIVASQEYLNHEFVDKRDLGVPGDFLGHTLSLMLPSCTKILYLLALKIVYPTF